MTKIMTCALCGLEFESGWSEAEALAELYENFGNVSPEDCEVVCDDCWEKMKPQNNPEVFAKYKAEVGDGQ
jgi:hypothetical protein